MDDFRKEEGAFPAQESGGSFSAEERENDGAAPPQPERPNIDPFQEEEAADELLAGEDVYAPEEELPEASGEELMGGEGMLTGPQMGGEAAAEMKKGLSKGGIAGVVAGAAVLLAAVVLGLLYAFGVFGGGQGSLTGAWKSAEQDGLYSFFVFEEDGTAFLGSNQAGFSDLGYAGSYELTDEGGLKIGITVFGAAMVDETFIYSLSGDRLSLTASDGQTEELTRFDYAYPNIPEADRLIDDALLGVWEDEEGQMSYVFDDQGTLKMTMAGLRVIGTYKADGKEVTMTLGQDAAAQTQTFPYEIRDGVVTIGEYSLQKKSK